MAVVSPPGGNEKAKKEKKEDNYKHVYTSEYFGPPVKDFLSQFTKLFFFLGFCSSLAAAAAFFCCSSFTRTPWYLSR